MQEFETPGKTGSEFSSTLPLRPGLIELVLDSLDEGIHVVDKHGITIFYNRVAAELDELVREEVVGKHLLEVFPSLNEETSTLLRVLRTGRGVFDQEQTFTTYKSRRITTINSTIPLYQNGELVGAVEVSRNITRLRKLTEQVASLRSRLYSSAATEFRDSGEAVYTFDDIIGKSPSLTRAITRAKKAAEIPSPVMVWGPTGSGKELLVQAIHNAGPRRERPFIAQNCAALPESLLEGILFGTAKGGFTGAMDRPGLFELAHGGTLFLDEIDSMNPGLQAKLLRVIQDRCVRRVGGTRVTKVDVRIITALGSQPEKAVDAGKLRRDLYYRLNVFSIEVPALKERKEDIPDLAAHFIAKYNKEMGTRVKALDPEVLSFFLAYDWPGNVRELQHAIEAALAASDSDRLSLCHLPDHLQAAAKSFAISPAASSATSVPASGEVSRSVKDSVGQRTKLSELSLRTALNIIEMEFVRRAMAEANNSVSEAARKLGIPRQTLQYKLRKFGLSSETDE